MNIEINMCFSYDEIIRNIPFGIIHETMSSCKWKTGSVRRKYNEHFTEEERENIIDIKTKSTYIVTHKIPQKLHLTFEKYLLWIKLANFCKSI